MNLDEGGGKAKHRWNHGAKPYSRPGERNPSFRDKLQSVANFLMPSWMPVLLGWPESSNNESDNVPTEDEEDNANVPSVEDRLPPIGISPPPVVKSPSVASTSRVTKPLVTGFEIMTEPIAENGSEYSAHSVSTSGCSSMRDNQPDPRSSAEDFSTIESHARRKGIAPLVRAPLRSSLSRVGGMKRSHDAVENAVDHESEMSNSRLSHSALWSDDSMTQVPHSRPQPTSRGSKPTFNVSSFGSPSWKDRSLLNNSIHNSPFYSGATTFMGSSAYRTICQPEVTPSKRQRVQPRPVLANHRTSGMGTTAKKILDALEKMSTPLTDAKKIPVSRHYLDTTLCFKKATLKRDYTMRNLPREPSDNTPGGPPRKRLMLPGTTSIAKNLHPLNSRPAVQTASVTATSTPRVAASASSYVPPAAVSDSMPGHSGGKIKSTKKSSFHYSAKPQEDEFLPPLSLPSVALPITSLPVIKLPLIVPAHKDVLTTPSLFTFSSPIHQSTPVLAAPKSSSDKIADFTFSSPLPASETAHIKVDCRPPLSKSLASTSAATFQNFAFKTPHPTSTPSLKLKAKVENNSPVAGPSASSGELKTGSVLDILLKKPASATSLNNASVPVATKGGTVSVNSSIPVTNGVAATNSSASAMAQAAAKPATAAPAGFGDKFKPPPGNWECPTCMISNSSDVSSCAACTTKKPAAKSAVPALQTAQTSSSFGSQFKPPSGSWECDTCMVRNSSKDTKCIACETVRAGSIPMTSAAGVVTASGFKLGAFVTAPVTSAPTFHFGVVASTSSTSNASSTVSTFSFGSNIGTASASSAPASGFVFGATANTDTGKASTGSFVFGSTTTAAAVDSATKGFGAEKAESTGKSTDKSNSSDKPSPSGFSFGIAPVSSSATPSIVLPTPSSTTSTPVVSLSSKVSVSSSGMSEPVVSLSGFAFPVPSTTPVTTSGFSLPASTEAKTNSGFFFKPPEDANKPKLSDEPVKQTTATSGSGGGFTFSLPQSNTNTSAKRERDSEEPSSKQSKSSLPTFNSFGSSTSTSTSAVSFTFGIGSSTGLTKTSSQAQPTTGSPGPLFNTGPATMSSATVSTPALTSALISSKPATSFVNPEASKPSPATPFGSPSSTSIRTVSIPMFGSASLSTSMPSMVGSATTMTTSVFGSIPSSSTFLAQPTTTLPVFGTASSGPIATTVQSQVSLPPFSSLQSSSSNIASVIPVTTSTATAPLLFGSGASVNNATTTATTTANNNQPFAFSSGVGSFSGFGPSSTTTPAVNFGVSPATTAAPSATPFQSSSAFGSNPQPQFNAPTTTAAMSFPAIATTVPTATFSFGATNPAPFSTPATAPAFGAPSATTAAAAAPAFGSSGPLFGSPAPGTGFGGFGAPPANTTSLFGGTAPAPAPAVGGFNFSAGPNLSFGGGMQPSSSNEVFTFSANPQPSMPRQPEPAQLPFGQQPAVNPAAGNPLPSFSATPQLNFSASGSSNIFQFSAASPAGTNPFEPRANSTSQRQIRRAVRRRKP